MIIERACCFCGEVIPSSDRAAIEITLRNLWGGQAAQGLQCHSNCAVEAFPEKTAMVDPECLRD